MQFNNRLFLLILILFIPVLACGGGKNIKDKTASSQSAADKNNTPAGVWEDAQTGSKHTIVRNGNGYKVESIITDGYDDVSEVMEIKDSKYENGTLSWSYFVPSTGYMVYFELVSVDENKMLIKWTNNDGKGNILKGDETLIRIINGKRSFEPETSGEEYNNYNDSPDDESVDNPNESGDDQRGNDYENSPEDEYNNSED
jgi:hypothetical protein